MTSDRIGLKKIKLLALTDSLGLGGTEKQLYIFLKHLDKKLFKSHIIVFDSKYNFFKEPLQKEGIIIWPIPANYKTILQRLFYMIKIFQNLKPDIVHSWTFHLNPYAGLIGWIADVPVRIGSLRNALVSTKKLSPLRRFLSLYSVSRIVVNSKYVFNELTAKKNLCARVVLVPNCVEFLKDNVGAKNRSIGLSHFGIKEYHRLVGTVGNLRKQKNHNMYIKALASILPHFSDVRGLIIGQAVSSEPGLLKDIEAMIKESGVDGKVILLGFYPYAREFMSRFSIFCLSSDYESMPNVILEAMAASCPIVATKTGDIPEVVKDGVNGLLVEVGDVKGFARAVKYLLENSDIAKKLAANACAMIKEKFRHGESVHKLERLYLELLAKAKRED